MGKKSCALIGPGVGPMVQVGKKSVFTIRGLEPGDSARVDLFKDKEAFVTLIVINGSHEAPSCNYARVTYEGKNKSFIACVLIGDEDALPCD